MMPTKRILFIGPHRPGRNPSQRFRIEQYFPNLQQGGFTWSYSWFINAADDLVFYQKGHWFHKGWILGKAFLIRWADVLRAHRYDIIFVQREAFPLGTALFEYLIALSTAKLVFDFDDALWIEDTSEVHRSWAWLKRPSKIAEIIALSDLVLAGNTFLADYASRFCRNVQVIPTVIDTERYQPIPHFRTPVCIGWTGSHTTLKYAEMLFPIWRKLHQQWGDQIRFLIICNEPPPPQDFPLAYLRWNERDEIEQLRQIDIGLMPLPDNDWAKGKCGLKAIQYMAMEIAPVVSPVGVNTAIVQHGHNGIHASCPDDWFNAINQLIVDPALRQRMGQTARQTIETHYALAQTGPQLAACLRALCTE